MPIVYRLETETSRKGPFSGMTPAWDVNKFALKHGRDLAADLPGPREDPPILRVWKNSREPLRFGFATIKAYERWTKHQDVRDAFAAWKSKSFNHRGERLQFAVYEVPKIAAKSSHQAIFDFTKAKLIDRRSPATPRERRSFIPTPAAPEALAA